MQHGSGTFASSERLSDIPHVEVLSQLRKENSDLKVQLGAFRRMEELRLENASGRRETVI